MADLGSNRTAQPRYQAQKQYTTEMGIVLNPLTSMRWVFAESGPIRQTGLLGQGKVAWEHLIAVRLSGDPLRLLSAALETALALELRLFAQFNLALALFEGLTRFSDDCTSTSFDVNETRTVLPNRSIGGPPRTE